MAYASDHTSLVVNDVLEKISLPEDVSELTIAIAVKDYAENVLGIELPLSEVRTVVQDNK